MRRPKKLTEKQEAAIAKLVAKGWVLKLVARADWWDPSYVATLRKANGTMYVYDDGCKIRC